MDDLLGIELRQLLLRYGRRRTLDTLASLTDQTPAELEAELMLIKKRKTSRKRTRVPAAVELVAEVSRDRPESADLLRTLAIRYENRSFLPHLRDVERFLDRAGAPHPHLKSRRVAAYHVMARLGRLSVDKLEHLVASPLEQEDSDFALLARQIMGREATGRDPSLGLSVIAANRRHKRRATEKPLNQTSRVQRGLGNHPTGRAHHDSIAEGRVSLQRTAGQANRTSSEELSRIFQEIAGKGLWVPVTGGTETEVGPLATVYLRYSDIMPDAGAPEGRYWEVLRNVPRQGALGVIAFINNILVLGNNNIQVHRTLNEKFLPKELRRRVAAHKLEQLPRPARAAFTVVFNRVGCLQMMRHLMLYGTDSTGTGRVSVEGVGELALLANEFIQRDSLPTEPGASSSEIPLQFVPIWDIYNPGDLAYVLPRMFTILTEALPSADSEVQRLSSKLGIDPSSFTVEGMSLVDFVSVVFGLYAFGRKVGEVGNEAVIFDYKQAFEKAPGMLPAVERFVARRGLTLSDYRRHLESPPLAAQEALSEEIKQRSFLTVGLNVLRHFPLLRLEGSRVTILDLQFLVDLLSSGVYWSIFDELPQSRRETFQQLWGRLLELYAVGLLREFYPPLSGFLKADLIYKGGQIDALLDFAGEVVVFEIKSSLLSEGAKRKGDRTEFEEQVNLKFVRNQDGKPKAVLQLAKSCQSIAADMVPATVRPSRIYPVVVGEEPALQTLGFNTYLNEVFQREVGHSSPVRPLTVMTTSEFEEMLAYTSKNVFSWGELLETRFADEEVIGDSVHQAIYDWRHKKGLGLFRNEVLIRRFKEIFEMMKKKYQFQE